MSNRFSEAMERRQAHAERIVENPVQRFGEPVYKFTVTSKTTIHQYDGWIEVRIYNEAMLVRWEGDTDWLEVQWWELMNLSDSFPPKLRDELQEIREQAREEAVNELITDFKKNPGLWRNETEKEKP